MEKLVFKLNGGAPTVIALDDAVITVGRHPSNTVVIDSKYLSDYHARITRLTDSGGFEIQDLESRNSTKVNGIPISRGILRNGDRLEFGSLLAHFEGPEESGGGNPREEGTSEHASLSRELDRARQELSSARWKLSMVGAELVLAQSVGRTERDAIEKEREQIAEQRRELERERVDRSSDADEVERRAGLRAEIADGEAQLDHLGEELARLRSEVESETKTLEGVVANVAGQRDQLASTRGELEQVAQQVAAGEARLSRCGEDRVALDAELEAGRSELALIGQEIAAKTARLETYRAQEMELSARFATVSEQMEAKFIELKIVEERRAGAVAAAESAPPVADPGGSETEPGSTLESALSKLGFDLRAFPQSPQSENTREGE